MLLDKSNFTAIPLLFVGDRKNIGLVKKTCRSSFQGFFVEETDHCMSVAEMADTVSAITVTVG